MAVSTNSIQVTWAAVNSKSVLAGTSEDSDNIAFSSTAIYGEIMLKAANDGTPAAGDTVDFYLQKIDDPDQDATNDQETAGMWLAQLDVGTNATDVKVVSLPIAIANAKLHAESNAATNGITVSARITEKLSA